MGYDDDVSMMKGYRNVVSEPIAKKFFTALPSLVGYLAM